LITNRRLPGGGSDSEVQWEWEGLKQQAKDFGKLRKLWQGGWQGKNV